MFNKKYYLIIPTRGSITTAESLDFMGDFITFQAINFQTRLRVKKVYIAKNLIESIEEYDSWPAFENAVKRRIEAAQAAASQPTPYTPDQLKNMLPQKTPAKNLSKKKK